jgi:hypothetical protein
LTYIRGRRGGGIRPPTYRGGVWGVIMGRGIIKNPYVNIGGREVYLIYPNNIR